MLKKYFLITFLLLNLFAKTSFSVLAEEATSAATLNTTNQLEAENTLKVEANSGNNTAVASETQTGTATVSATVTAVANTTLSGENYQFEIVTPENTTASGNNQPIINSTINNEATVTTTLTISANTGNNTATNSALISTGNVDINTLQTTIGNTIIEGSNWYFGVINLGGGKADYVLPNEWLFLDPGSLANEPPVSSITAENNSSQNSQIKSENNTGNNTASNSTINTGQIKISVKEVSELNETIIGDNWLLLKINKFAPWSGQLVGWWGNMAEDESSLIAWIKLPSSFSSQSTETEISNQAQNRNQTQIQANTGNNHASDNSSVTTGNININSAIFTKLNTTVRGNHWYYAVVNIFGPWSGNLLFAKPNQEPQSEPPLSNTEGNAIRGDSQASSQTENSPPPTPLSVVLWPSSTITSTQAPNQKLSGVLGIKKEHREKLALTPKIPHKTESSKHKPWLGMGTLGSLIAWGVSRGRKKMPN